METIRVEIPFSICKRSAVVPVYLVDTDETLEDGTTPDVLVQLKPFLEDLIGKRKYELGVNPYLMRDYSALCRGKGQCVTWADLSRLGWAVRRKDGKPDITGMRVLFFAQCIMRGFLHRVVSIERRCVEQAKHCLVYWEPEVRQMRDDYQAFLNVNGKEDEFMAAIRDVINGLWRRVLAAVDERNRRALKRALDDEKAKVLSLRDSVPE